jgi:hypothetical protein
MGRSHSGSTILDILLGNSSAVMSCGELIMGLMYGGEGDWPCSCGESLASCEFWRAVRGRVSASGGSGPGMDWERFAALSIAQAHKFQIPRTWWASTAEGRVPARFAELRSMTRRFTAAIGATSGRPVVLDSSKRPSRAIFLLKYLPEARLIHIVRDPRRVLESHWWRFKIKDTWLAERWLYRGPLMPLAFVEAALFWLLANLLCEAIARIDPARVVRLRYEDLRDRPAIELRRIAAAFDLPLDDVIARVDRGDAFATGHMIGGNPVRMTGQVRLDRGWEKKREPLPRSLERVAEIICWPLMLRYGYPLRRGGRTTASRETRPDRAGARSGSKSR